MSVSVTRWFAERGAEVSGIYNCGTGRAATFNEVARAIRDWHGHGEISYREFPPDLLHAYQSFTEADLTSLRAAGYDAEFRSVDVGVREYLNWLDS